MAVSNATLQELREASIKRKRDEITVELTVKEFCALNRLRLPDVRSHGDEIRWLIREEAKRRGVWELDSHVEAGREEEQDEN